MKVEGFRRDSEAHFSKFVLSGARNATQSTPFIVIENGSITSCFTVSELLEKYADCVDVLQAWPGEWRTDVFYFKVGELRRFVGDDDRLIERYFWDKKIPDKIRVVLGPKGGFKYASWGNSSLGDKHRFNEDLLPLAEKLKIPVSYERAE